MTLIFDKLSEIDMIHVRAKFLPSKWNGLWIIIFTVKIGDDAKNNATVASTEVITTLYR